MAKTVLITGAAGQIGANLIDALQAKQARIIASDLIEPSYLQAINISLDVLDKSKMQQIVAEYHVEEIYHLAALLSAKGEHNPQLAWDINMLGLLNILDVSQANQCKVFWPSSIAVFGNSTPKHLTPQVSILEPSTVYGISKVAGELWCKYYFDHYQVDVRSVRFPGLISWKGDPGGGTTDYAVDIFHRAVNGEAYTCFLSEDTYLPMLYMDDAIAGILQLMEAPAEQISCRTSYNISGISFSPKEIYQSIQSHFPDFKMTYQPDFRQEIANSWPASIDDQLARKDWNWNPQFDLEKMTKLMIEQLSKVYGR